MAKMPDGTAFPIGTLTIEYACLEAVVMAHLANGPETERVKRMLLTAIPSREHSTKGRIYADLPSLGPSMFNAIVNSVMVDLACQLAAFAHTLTERVGTAIATIPAGLRVCHTCGKSIEYSRQTKVQCSKCREDGLPLPQVLVERDNKHTMAVHRARGGLNKAARAALQRWDPTNVLLDCPDLAGEALRKPEVLNILLGLAPKNDRLWSSLERWGTLHPESQMDQRLRALPAQSIIDKPLPE
jgi:hypothetical protein